MARIECVESFIMELKNGEYEKDNQPNCGHDLSPEYVDQKVRAYREVLTSDIFFNDVINK